MTSISIIIYYFKACDVIHTVKEKCWSKNFTYIESRTLQLDNIDLICRCNIGKGLFVDLLTDDDNPVL